MGYSMMMNHGQHRIVEKVLQGYLDGEALNSAVSLWDQQYRNQPMDKLSYFVFEIATSSTLRSLRKQILLDLEKNLQTTELSQSTLTSEIPLGIDQEMLVVDKVKTQDSVEEAYPENSPVIQSEALLYCMKTLLISLQHLDVQDVKDVFHEQFEEDRQLPEFMKTELMSILFLGQQPNYLIYDEDHIRQALNLIYSVICEFLGPVKADHALSKTIQQTTQAFPMENFVRFL